MELKSKYEAEIDLKLLILKLLKKVNILILAGVIVGSLMVGYKCVTSGSTMMEDTRIAYQPKTDYLGTATIFLGSTSNNITSTTARTYLIGHELLEGAIKNLNLDLTYGHLYNMINLIGSTDTKIVINVAGSEEKLVQDITAYLATTGSANLSIKLTNPEVVLLEPAFTTYREYNVEIPETVHSIPKLIKELSKYALIGFVLGIFMAAAIYTVIFMLDSTIKEENDAYKYLGIPILGTVSIIKGTKKYVEKGKHKRNRRLSQYSEQL